MKPHIAIALSLSVVVTLPALAGGITVQRVARGIDRGWTARFFGLKS